MDINDTHWEAYETRFRALAEEVPMHKGAMPELASSSVMLCLYGENALSPDQEFDMLAQLEKAVQEKQPVGCVEMLTSYWEDLVLFLP